MALEIILSPRNIQGQYSVTHRVPNALSGHVQIATEIDPADVVDPTKTMKLDIYRSDDNVEWRYWMGFTWQGGPGVQSPFIGTYNVAELQNKYLRLDLDIPSRIRIGLKLGNP